MKLVLGISVCFVSAIIVFLTYIIHDKIQREQIQRQTETEPFIVSEYFSRMEQAALEILESQKPVDQTIILWLGLDGLIAIQEIIKEYQRQKTNQRSRKGGSARKPRQYHAEAEVII